MKKLIPFVLLFALFFTACGKDEGAEVSPVPPSINSTPEMSGAPVETPEPFRHPLTGEVVDEEPGNNRPYAIMINNISFAQPHMGVSQADIIYELLAEGDITRMLAIFSDVSDVDVIGSVRSARSYYVELARSYDAIYVHAGGSEQAYYDIPAKGVDAMDYVRGAYADAIFYRDPNRMQHGIEHSAFTTGEKLLEYTPILGYDAEHATDDYDYGLLFSDEPEMSGSSPASSVHVSFGGLKSTNFTYNSDGQYTGEQFGSAYIDGSTGEAVRFKNLLVLYTESRIIDDYGRRSVELNGTGSGHFFCNGEMVDITWSRSGDGAQFKYFLSDGTPLVLGVGRTYIGIVPTESVITAE